MITEVKENFVTLELKTVLQARKEVKPILCDLCYNTPKSNRVKYTAINTWGHDANVYMNICGTNMVLMHVKNNNCIILPRTIITVNGQEIDVAKRFSKYYFYINPYDDVVGKVGKKEYKLYRMLFALILYGNELRRISWQLEVHHKWMRYLNIMECITLVTKKEHAMIHSETSQKSHRMGKLINNVDDLKMFIAELENMRLFWKNRDF